MADNPLVFLYFEAVEPEQHACATSPKAVEPVQHAKTLFILSFVSVVITTDIVGAVGKVKTHLVFPGSLIYLWVVIHAITTNYPCFVVIMPFVKPRPAIRKTDSFFYPFF